MSETFVCPFCRRKEALDPAKSPHRALRESKAMLALTCGRLQETGTDGCPIVKQWARDMAQEVVDDHASIL